jgi:predicted ATPase
LGSALTSAKGYAAPETGEVLARARALCRTLGDPPQTFQVLYGLWNFYFVAGDVPQAYELAEEYLDLLQHDAERTHRVAAHSAVGQTLVMLGQPDSAKDHLERSLSFYRPGEDRALCFIFGEDPALSAASFLPWALWLRGLAAQALARSEEAFERSQALSHPLTVSVAYGFTTGLHYFRREPAVAQKIAEAGIAFCAEHGVPIFAGLMNVVRGWALAEQGLPEEGLEVIHRGIEQWRATGTGLMLPAFGAMQAEVHARWDRFDDGLRALEEAFDRIRLSGEHVWEPELHRLKGMLLLGRSAANEVEAEARFRKAIEVARGQNSKAFELRAAMSLARLLRRQDRSQAARDLLAPVFAEFTEGFDTPDLIEAKALLDETNLSS